MSSTKVNVTIKEIAKRAGVSVSTVSRVMSGKKTAIPISEKTRQVVLKVCNELKFLPDVNYTRLQERRSYTIALLVPRATAESPTPVFLDDNMARVLSELEVVLADHSYSILVQTVDKEYEDQRQHLRILRNNTVDALLIWDAFSSHSFMDEILEEHRPSIFLGFPYPGGLNSIVPDVFQGSYDMTRFLLAKGHKKIGFIAGGSKNLTDTLRTEGYRHAMEEHGLEPIVAMGNYKQESGARCSKELLDNDPEISAIFAAGDLMAVGVLQYARSAGISVPGKLAVAGFDGSFASSVTTPSLTTCRLPMKEIGREAAETIVEQIDKGSQSQAELRQERRIPVEILERESTG